MPTGDLGFGGVHGRDFSNEAAPFNIVSHFMNVIHFLGKYLVVNDIFPNFRCTI